jgi:hypothetical protein
VAQVTIFDFECFVLDQVNIDLHDRASHASIGDTWEVKSAPELEEWSKLSTIWEIQPPDGHIHLFIKLPATSEQKRLLPVEHHLNSLFTLFHCSFMLHPAPCSLFLTKFFINILCMPLDEGNTDSLVTSTEVQASARIVDLQYWIYSKLQANMFIRYSHHSPIFILPMKDTPTVDAIWKEDHTVLCNNTMLPSQLPLDAVLDYFRAQDFDTIHFLVWLPPKNSKSLHQMYSVPA